LYKSDTELATALRVKEIVEVEVMEGQKVNNKDLLGIIVNMSDYNIGADKGGARRCHLHVKARRGTGRREILD
jgi:hypothetical protein